MGARKNAFALLVEMGHAFLRFGPDQEGEVWVTWGWGRWSAHRPWGDTPPNHWPKQKGEESCLTLELGRLLLSGQNPLPWGAPRCSMQSGCALVCVTVLVSPSQRPCNAISS